MSFRTWLGGLIAGSPTPRVEPPVIAGALAGMEKQPGDIVGSLNSMAFPQPLLYAALGGYASNTGVPVTPFTGLQSAAVYGCTKCIGEESEACRCRCAAGPRTAAGRSTRIIGSTICSAGRTG